MGSQLHEVATTGSLRVTAALTRLFEPEREPETEAAVTFLANASEPLYTSMYTHNNAELLPSSACAGHSATAHPLEPTSPTYLTHTCTGKQFTALLANGSAKFHGCSGATVTKRGGDAKTGALWAWTACGQATNLRIRPVALQEFSRGQSTDAPSALVILLDSWSHGRFDALFPKTKAILQKMPRFFRFNHTGVFGANTKPNIKQIVNAAGNNLFRAFADAGAVTSVFDDYCPDHGLCKLYPFRTHRVCSKLLCNYGKDIIKLFLENQNAGCAEGEWWIQHHLRYITDFWRVYPRRQKFHFMKTYGCHATYFSESTDPRQHLIHTCASNDQPLAQFLQDSYKDGRFNNTLVLIMSDHGFHYAPNTANDFIMGEIEHRNPFLSAIVPATLPTTFLRRNTKRFVTHHDVHATLMGIAGAGNLSAVGFDLLHADVPDRRSCSTSHIPAGWCNCFDVANAGSTNKPRVYVLGSGQCSDFVNRCKMKGP